MRKTYQSIDFSFMPNPLVVFVTLVFYFGEYSVGVGACKLRLGVNENLSSFRLSGQNILQPSSGGFPIAAPLVQTGTGVTSTFSGALFAFTSNTSCPNADWTVLDYGRMGVDNERLRLDLLCPQRLSVAHQRIHCGSTVHAAELRARTGRLICHMQSVGRGDHVWSNASPTRVREETIRSWLPRCIAR